MAIAEGYKCIKFENRLRPEINQGIGYHKIRQFLKLVNRCKIYDEYSRAQVSHYKNLSERMGNQRHMGTPYSAPTDKGRQRVADGK